MGVDAPARLANSLMSEMVGAMTLARATSDAAEASKLLAASRLELSKRVRDAAADGTDA